MAVEYRALEIIQDIDRWLSAVSESPQVPRWPRSHPMANEYVAAVAGIFLETWSKPSLPSWTYATWSAETQSPPPTPTDIKDALARFHQY
ncbi:hypothetical protein GGX14DRAFT_574102 [Mycena pura]|nr:hypothetical protein GGX14DRAFT_574102 [Mycena pura]